MHQLATSGTIDADVDTSLDPATVSIAQCLARWRAGDRSALEALVPVVYNELRQVARRQLSRESPAHTLSPTALVHETYLRLQRAGQVEFVDRKHFLAYAAQVMRTIVIDAVRARRADRRGGDVMHVTLNTEVGESVAVPGEDVLRVHEARRLLEQGCSVEEAGESAGFADAPHLTRAFREWIGVSPGAWGRARRPRWSAGKAAPDSV